MDNYKFKLGLAIAREEELKAKIDALAVYDEDKEREIFESWYGSLPVSKFKESMWMAWESCAKSRARSAE